MTDEEKSKIKFYKPMFLDAVACHLGNGAQSVNEHCRDAACMPRHQSSILETVQPFADVCKHNYDVIIYELESRWTTFERTKIIPKGKTTKAGVNQLISVLRTTV